RKLTEEEKNEIFDAEWVDYFNDPQIDHWLLRNGFNRLYSYDLVPEPKIIIAVMKACRKMDDFPMALRIIEAVRLKSKSNPEIFQYIMQEISPTLQELGIPTLEEMG
ncbi:cytochrome c oxidase subunit Va family protein, partial [Salmonella sp. s54836]|uniref:cytochrome c oxidase subunit Va family protein n=1 Tax=Salmonella sp. s54836 TaxID=3159673 RepID=UPI0039817BC8